MPNKRRIAQRSGTEAGTTIALLALAMAIVVTLFHGVAQVVLLVIFGVMIIGRVAILGAQRAGGRR